MKKDLLKIITLSFVVGLWGIISWVCLYLFHKYNLEVHFWVSFLSILFNIPAACYCVGCIENYMGGQND